MPSFFSRLKGKDGPAKVSKSKKGAQQTGYSEEPPKPKWEDAWTRTTVEPEEVQDLIRGCTVELKSRGMQLYAPNRQSSSIDIDMQEAITILYPYSVLQRLIDRK